MTKILYDSDLRHIPKYSGWSEIPGNLKTKTQLSREGLKPGKDQQPAGRYFQYQSKTWIMLYDVAQAVPKRKVSDKQREALAKAHAALKQKYSCEDCGCYSTQVRDGLCRDCARHRVMVEEWERKEEERKQRQAEGQSMFQRWSKNPSKYLLFDTETTGLGKDDEICAVAVADLNGQVLFDSLVSPIKPISNEASQVNGITNEDVLNQPCWPEVWEKLRPIIQGKILLAYHSDFHIGMLQQTNKKYGITAQEIPHECVMCGYDTYLGNDDGWYMSLWQASSWDAISNRPEGHRAIFHVHLISKLIKSVVQKIS
jgi:DNA polymerase III subunit epsilon